MGEPLRAVTAPGADRGHMRTFVGDGSAWLHAFLITHWMVKLWFVNFTKWKFHLKVKDPWTTIDPYLTRTRCRLECLGVKCTSFCSLRCSSLKKKIVSFNFIEWLKTFIIKCWATTTKKKANKQTKSYTRNKPVGPGDRECWAGIALFLEHQVPRACLLPASLWPVHPAPQKWWPVCKPQSKCHLESTHYPVTDDVLSTWSVFSCVTGEG